MVRRIILIAALLLLLLQGVVFSQTDNNIEFYGTIQSANSTAIVINGQIIDMRGAMVNTAFTPGLAVRIQATMLADGSLVARQIDALPVGIIPGIVEINGTVLNLTAATLNVSGQVIDITNAEISGSIALGQSVRVFAVATAPGTWQARFVDAAGNVPAPLSTPEVGPAPNVLPPASTPEVGPSTNVLPPASTPEVSSSGSDDERDDDSSGRGSGGDRDGDNSGRGSGGDRGDDSSGGGSGDDRGDDSSGKGSGNDD